MQPTPRKPTTPPIPWSRILGTALIGTGALGLLISLVGLIFVAILGSAATGALSRELNTLDRALSATNDGLSVADSSLAEAQITLGSISTTIANASTAITATQPTLTALEELTGTGLPQTISSTQQALASAQEAARAAEGVLRALTFFGQSYSPEIPLDVAIGEVSSSLGALTPSLTEVAQGLGTADEQLTIIAGDLTKVAAGLDAIAVDIGGAATAIDQYQAVVADLRSELELIREGAPGWIVAMRVGLSLLLLWLALAQIAPLTQGWALLERAKREEQRRQ